MRSLVCLAVLASACGNTEPGSVAADSAVPFDPDLTVSLEPPEAGYQIVTEPFEVPPNSEVDMCSIVRLDPDDDEQIAWVNHMESLSSDNTHHMNVVIGQFSFLDAFVGDGASETALEHEFGTYPCSEMPIMEAGFPIFPSQRDNQEITLPEGVAAPLPLPLVAVFSHHYLNPHDEPLTINAALNLSTVPADEVEHVGGLLFDDVPDLEVPALSQRSESRTCVVDREVEIALVSTHTHEWASCATMNHYDGETGEVEEEPFYVNRLWDQPPILHFQPGTFALQPGDGVHWSCHYENPSDFPIVNNGTAEGEMCVFAAVTWPAPFDVTYVQETVATRDLTALLDLMGEVLGGCDERRDDIEGPWPTEDSDVGSGQVCSGMDQTESNTLY